MAESQVETRSYGSIVLSLLLILIIYGHWQLEADLEDTATYTGWTLVVLSILLSIYNLRKKLSTLPIGRVWYWRKMHTFFGWLAVAVFFFHAGFMPPTGPLNFLLWLLFVLVLLSGIFGLWFSLNLPARIALDGERLQFERIPHLREALSRRAEHAVLSASSDGIGQPLAEFHNKHLRRYLDRPREFFRHWFNNPRQADHLLLEINDIRRYVDSSTEHFVTELMEIIEMKDNLDRQFALQKILKKWAYIHVALNYASWSFIALHILAMYTFRPEYGL